MSLLSRHVSELKSEEFVLGLSHGFKGTLDGKDVESTKITIVVAPSKKNWTGFTAIDHSVASEAVGKKMLDKQFPARCLVTYRRGSKSANGKDAVKDLETLEVVDVEYLSAVDLVDVKVPESRKAA